MVVAVAEAVKVEAFKKNKIDPLKKDSLRMGSFVSCCGPPHVQGLESRTHHSVKLPGKFG